MAKNFPHLEKETTIQTQESQRGPNKMNLKRTTLRHTIIKMIKVKGKERILKVARVKQLNTYKGNLIKL